MKGRLSFLAGKHYLTLTDGTELNIILNRRFMKWLSYHQEIDIYGTDHVYCGQYKTLRYPPYLIVDELVGIILQLKKAHETFKVSGRVFGVYANVKEKFNASNFLLINVGFEPFRFPLKLCFDELDDTLLVGKTISFICKRQKTDLFILEYKIIQKEPEYMSDLFEIKLTG